MTSQNENKNKNSIFSNISGRRKTNYYIGIDVGGTNTKIALIDSKGNLYHLTRLYNRDIELTKEKFLSLLVEKTNEIINKANQVISGIGISLPGLQKSDGSGTLFSINLPFLNGINFKKFFLNEYNLPVSIINDLVAHSLGEYQFGTGQKAKRLLYVSLGTGIGHTFINNGRPLIVINGISGDSGRMILDINSPICDASGVYGSAEALCGVKAIEDLIEKRGLKKKFCYSYEIIEAAKKQKDPDAMEILSIISHRVAQLLVNLASIFFPEIIALTGGQVEAGEFFIYECRNEFYKLSSNYFNQYFQLIGENRNIQIVKAETGGLAGLLGSIVPFLRKRF